MSQARALVIEDDAIARRALTEALRSLGLTVLEATSVEEGRPLIQGAVTMLFLDLGLPGISGGDFLPEIIRAHPTIPVVIVTADTSLERAVTMMRAGAYDYLVKPVGRPQLEAVVHRAQAESRLLREVRRLRDEVGRQAFRDSVIGASPKMRIVFERVRQAAPSRISVALLGESGTGKELLARTLHRESPRNAGPFVALNCAAVPAELLESQLFGHRKGAFTGALDDQKGHFQLADGGTLFLDEIGEMAPALQAKLLRTLQEGTILPVGAEKEVQVDVRIVAATNKDLEAQVETGAFREDLFYRIVAFPIHIPTLRERREDIPELAFHFLNKHRDDAGRPDVDHIEPEAMRLLQEYDWPGNVRQLENVVHRALLTCPAGNMLSVDALPDEVRYPKLRAVPADPSNPEVRTTATFHDPSTGKLRPLREIEEAAFRLALEESGGNTTRAAKTLGVARATFYRRLKQAANQ